MECRYVWLYLLIHSALAVLSISAAPTTEMPYIRDTSDGLSENKTGVDMTQIPSTDRPRAAAPANLSAQPTPGAGQVRQEAPRSGEFAQATTESVDVTTPAETETPRVESVLTTILYPSAGPSEAATEQSSAAPEEGEKWRSTEAYFINGLSDLLMENSGIDRIAEFVDEIANQHNSQLEKMDSSISTDVTPTTTESVEKIAEQVTNSMAKNALNTERADALEDDGNATANFTPTTEVSAEKNDSFAETATPSAIPQFIQQFDVLTSASTASPPERSTQAPMDTSTKKPKSGKAKKKVSKTVDTKKPFTLKASDLVHAATTTTTTTPAVSTTTEAHTAAPSSSEGPSDIPTTTTQATEATEAATTSSAAETTTRGRPEWTGDDYTQPESEDDVLVVEIEDTDNFTEVSPAEEGPDDAIEPAIKQSGRPDDMTDELFFPILVDRAEGATTAAPAISQEVPMVPTTPANVDKTEAPIDRDSDTFFYISNTEVKVVESVPTPDTHKETNFFPEIYEEDVFIDFSNKNHSHRGLAPDKLEEDIILSPLNFDPLTRATQKMHNDKQTSYDSSENHDAMDHVDNNLSISYIGESFIEIKESTTEMDSNNLMSPLNSDVIIQPVAMPDVPLSIGVPVIGELPPQIELVPPAQQHHDFDIDLRDTSHVFAHAGDYLVKNPSISAEVPILESSTASSRRANATATGQTPFVDDADLDTSFSDLQTLFTACLATLTLLMVVLVIVFGVRYLWRKYRPNQLAVNGLIADSSTDPLAIKSRTLSTDELKSADSEYTINRSSDTLESTADQGRNTCNGAAPIGALGAKSNHTGANGSVITMTLKNNHLIVETEERNDISRDARETKMHYSPSEKDGVFVVEVARGADSTGLAEEFSKNNQDILLQQKTNIEFTGPGVDQEPLISLKTDPTPEHQKVQIHDPPPAEKPAELILEVNDLKSDQLAIHAKTGLTQSNLSVSSSNGSNKDYCYGSQVPYTVETKGYKSSSPRNVKMDGRNEAESASNSEDGEETFINRKPIVTGAIYKQDTLDFESSIPLDISEVSASKCAKEDQLISEQHQLGNGEINALDEAKKWNDSGPVVNGEAEKESFTYPEPPSSEEIKCLHDSTVIENNMDSLPPPPPVDNAANQLDEQSLVAES
ncbi:uncharacterized protein LOC132262491 [Phlebotomus argentipes]|uniref:uncharacterized protein LOC132262491 n=1 Tax=Phlebotomus argentipes TaxID=94469 RepID=UPI0028935882|nr:uncharacterized protein LOC132262491 [Phlebotomus argentipes]